MPTEPLIFNKFSNCICATGDTLPKDPETNELDYEVELAIVIGQTVPRRTSEADAGQYILGAIMCSLNLDTCMVQSIMPDVNIAEGQLNYRRKLSKAILSRTTSRRATGSLRRTAGNGCSARLLITTCR